MQAIINWLFGCRHEESWQFSDKRGQYKKCTKCGKRLDVVVILPARCA